MYISPIEVNMVDNMHRLVMQTTEDGIMRAVWQMGFKVDAEQLTSALTQDKKRYEYAYDQGWHDCEKHYKEQLAKIANIATEKDAKQEHSMEKQDIEILKKLMNRAKNRELGVDSINYYYALKHAMEEIEKKTDA